MERAGLRLYGRLGCRRDAWSMLPRGGGGLLCGVCPPRRGYVAQPSRLPGSLAVILSVTRVGCL